MSPDSALGALAQRVARIEQRMDDLMERIVEKFAAVSEDIRIFGPLVREHDEMRAEMKFVRESLTQMLATQARLEERFQAEKAERVRGQAERKQELEAAIAERTAEMKRIEADREQQRKESRANNVRVVVSLIGVFVAAVASVIVQLISNGAPG